MSLQRVLAGVLPAQTRDDGAVTVAYEGTVASLRTLRIAEDLELISLVQLLAQNVPLSAGLRRTVAAQAEKTTLGTVILVELSATTADVGMPAQVQPLWRRSIWLPLQRRDHLARWHALRCALYSGRRQP